MKNPDRSELVKLADRLAALPTFKMATVVTVPGVACNERERDLIVTALRRLASSDSGVKVKPLVWRDHRPDSFPEPAWSAQTSFGFYNIEEVSASDSPAYVVRLHAHHFVADKDSLDEAKAAAQADYEARIRSALVSAPVSASTTGRQALNEVVTNGKWTEGDQCGEWKISKAVYDLAVEARDSIIAASEATKSDGALACAPTRRPPEPSPTQRRTQGRTEGARRHRSL
jgi:hypothetical protein